MALDAKHDVQTNDALSFRRPVALRIGTDETNFEVAAR